MFPSDYFPGRVSTAAPAVALFVKTDTVTQGNWTSIYGADGYVVPGCTPSPPAYSTVSVSNPLVCGWDFFTTLTRAPVDPSRPGHRLATCWFTTTYLGTDNFTVNVRNTDGQAHRVALYFLDWDSANRAERVDVIDNNSGAVLDSQSLSKFSNGIYLVWYVKGSVTFRVSNLPPSPNSVLSGVFFG